MPKKNYMKEDEMSLLKCVSMQLADDVVALVTYQYHTQPNPATGKSDRSKAKYRWLTRVCKISDIKAEMKRMMQDDVRLTPWKWPDDPTWDGKMCTKDSTMKRAASWLDMKLKKMVSWEEGQKQIKGWEETKQAFNPGATYIIDGYTATNGDTGISLTDKEALLNHIGQNLWVEVIPKSVLKARAAEAAKAEAAKAKEATAA